MEFTSKQFTAVVKIAIGMATVDGDFSEEEKLVVCLDLLSFGVEADDMEQLLSDSHSMNVIEAIRELRRLGADEKKYISGYFAAIILADGKIDARELELWRMVSDLAGLPEMTINEAYDYWKEI